MPTHLEIEFKTLLSLSEYENLSHRFSHVKPVRQVNHYFDTPVLDLRDCRLALRIRTFKDSAEMTLKVPQDVGNIEHNLTLSLDTALQLIRTKTLIDCQENISEIVQIIEAQGIALKNITCLGSLATTRQEYQMAIGLAALDVNEYLDCSDYEFELEVEDESQGKRAFDNFLETNNIEFRYARSKVVRFLDALRYRKN